MDLSTLDRSPCVPHHVDAIADEPASYSASPPEDASRVVGREVAERMADGRSLRLAAALVHGTRQASDDRAARREHLRTLVANAGCHPPESADADDLANRLKVLVRQSDRYLAEQLQLLVRFESEKHYEADGCRSMLVWMDVHLGVQRAAAFERLRVGRALADLPMLAALFGLGEISYSQLREVTRHATAETDTEFAVAILELSVTETIDYCRRFRHERDRHDDAVTETKDGQEAMTAAAESRAFDRRRLSVRDIDAYSKRVTLELPNDLAEELLRAMEQLEDELTETERELPSEAKEPVTTSAQRRADAAVLMSRRSLAHAGEAIAMADRYRVHVNVDVRFLVDGPIEFDGVVPVELPRLQAGPALSRASARRLAELAGFTLLATDAEGQVIGTQSPAAPFSKRQLKTLRARDRSCRMPGCGATRHLVGHHIVHREHGGRSTLENAVLLCSSCHRLLHEGGFRLERRATAPRLDVPVTVKPRDPSPDEAAHVAAACARAGERVGRVRPFRLIGPDGKERCDVRTARRPSPTAWGKTRREAGDGDGAVGGANAPMSTHEDSRGTADACAEAVDGASCDVSTREDSADTASASAAVASEDAGRVSTREDSPDCSERDAAPED